MSESLTKATAFLSPLRGLLIFIDRFPRLAPWAAFFRRFAAACALDPPYRRLKARNRNMRD